MCIFNVATMEWIHDFVAHVAQDCIIPVDRTKEDCWIVVHGETQV